MSRVRTALIACILIVLSGQSYAQSPDRVFGGDLYTTGETGLPLQAARDVLAAGPAVYLDGSVAEDTQASGFNVDINAAIGGDLLAAGFAVNVGGTVGGDISAMGFSVRTDRSAEVTGNARLMGARVAINGPVGGALAAMGQKVTLNAEVKGDVALTGETIVFGPAAHIGGTLTYSAPEPIEIPVRVISSDRVTYEALPASTIVKDTRETWSDWEYPVYPTFMSLLAGFVVTLGFFVVIGALFLALTPAKVSYLRRSIEARPGMTLLTGVIGLSILFGLVPISMFTVVGIPLVPIVLLTTVVVWTLGYLLGAYALAMRVMRGFGARENPEIWMRLLALVIGVTLVTLLNFIPILGWMVNFALVLLGIGAMTTALFERLIGNVGPALDVDMKPVEPNAT